MRSARPRAPWRPGSSPRMRARRRAPAPAGRHGRRGPPGAAPVARSGARRAPRLGRAAAGPPRRCESRRRSRAAPRAGRAPAARERLVVEEQAARCARAAADPAAQLVQLGETEALGVLDHHHSGRGHVDTRPRSPWSPPAAGSRRGRSRASPGPCRRPACGRGPDRPPRRSWARSIACRCSAAAWSSSSAAIDGHTQ